MNFNHVKEFLTVFQGGGGHNARKVSVVKYVTTQVITNVIPVVSSGDGVYLFVI